MIDSRTKLTVFHDDNSVFTDYSNSAKDYTRDSFSFTLVAAEDYLYLGFTKPFGATYVEMETPNTNSNTLSAEYFDGTSWQTLDLNDETNGLTRSAFITWDKELLTSTTINSVAAFYVRFRPDSDHSATTFRGINLVFSDDNMMKQEFFEIDNVNLLPNGESSHIATHVASRNMIVQEFRRLNYTKEDVNGNRNIINQWDLHDIFEVRDAATFLALSKIFFNLSDSVDDNWWQKYREYHDKYEESMRLAKLSVDLDDDGKKDDDEKVRDRQPFRWNR